MGSRVRQEQTKSGALSHRQPASWARMDGGFSFADMKRTSLGTSNTQGDGSSGPTLSGSWVLGRGRR